MTQRTRIIVAVIILIIVVGGILGIDALRRSSMDESDLAPGSIPIYVNDRLVGGFTPDDLEDLEEVSFVDAEEGKTQEGWMLRDVLRLHVETEDLTDDSTVTAISSSRGKSVKLTWAEVDDPANMVMFDLSGRGTLKLVSKLEQLDVRDEWVQDVDRIEIVR